MLHFKTTINVFFLLNQSLNPKQELQAVTCLLLIFSPSFKIGFVCSFQSHFSTFTLY